MQNKITCRSTQRLLTCDITYDIKEEFPHTMQELDTSDNFISYSVRFKKNSRKWKFPDYFYFNFFYLFLLSMFNRLSLNPSNT